MEIKRALLIGIDDYDDDESKLHGCVVDVSKLSPLLSTHDDKYLNFQTKSIIAPLEETPLIIENNIKREVEKIDRDVMLTSIKDLFSHKADFVLFYFSGHGYVNDYGGFIVAQNPKGNDVGVNMQEIMNVVEKASTEKLIQEIIIILDCCYSGKFGNISNLEPRIAKVPQGVTIISACEHSEFAYGDSRGGVLTKGVCNALNGGAADPLGNITAISLHTHLAASLSSAWSKQTLVFKTNNTKNYKTIKRFDPDFEFSILRLIPILFKDINYQYPLNTSMITVNDYGDKVLDRTAKNFLQLMKYNLVEIIGESDIVYAIIDSKKCQLTTLGRYLWRKVKSKI